MSKIIYKGQEYISGSQYQELTQTEYNALSEAEKKNGTLYFITDGVPGGGQDYVVEQGTSGIWTYRKWASGIAECWGHTNVASHTYAANGGYYNIVENLPVGLFNASPITVNASGRITSTVNTDIGFTGPNSASAIQTYLINRNSGAVTQTGTVYWDVRGTWK